MTTRGQGQKRGPAGGSGLPLSGVTVRPVADAVERERRDRTMNDGHYLGFRGMFGGGLRHVAAADGTWLALLGWCAEAFGVKTRDAWAP